MRGFKKHNVPEPENPVPLDSLKGPLDLDLGCGQGLFAFERARIFKNRQIIAIEKTRSRFSTFNQLLKKYEKPKNLWPIHTNAVWWLCHHAKENSFERIFLLYPNPYPKKRQANLRWINRPFMPYLLDLLKLGGRLEMRTNKRVYYTEFKEKIQLFKNISLKKDFTLKPAATPKTAFEKKYLERGNTCYVLEFVKLH